VVRETNSAVTGVTGATGVTGVTGATTIGVAATVVLLRDGPRGPEVLLLERPRHRGSFAGAWVFPGGAVDPDDGAGDASENGGGASGPGGEEPGVRRAAVREAREETGLVLEPDSLVTISCWVPPEGIPKRMRTWFYLAPDPGGPLTLATDECVDALWLRPQDALGRHTLGELRLVAPTWVTLWGLVGAASVADILANASRSIPERFESRAGVTANGAAIFWMGDVAFTDDALAEADGARHRLEIGALPWVYRRWGVGGAR
jgi:8-oxo-dGTP pyrophosphatase MutT (NUDIX family)